jgi:hypothetical protein
MLPEWLLALAGTCAARAVREVPRERVVDFLRRVSNAGHPVHEDDAEFVLPHPDGEIRVCWDDARGMVRQVKGDVEKIYGFAWNEAELEQFLSSALGSPIR